MKNCLFCNIEFVPNNVIQKYCAVSCYKKAKQLRDKNHHSVFCKKCNCIECGINFIGHSFRTKLCSKKCVSKYNSKILKKFLDIPVCLSDASRKLDKTLGYVRVYVPMHPEANTWGYVYEHRVIAEQMMGRNLLPDEIVHHKNGKRWDNREENLEVMNKKDHARLHGQREEDKDI